MGCRERKGKAAALVGTLKTPWTSTIIIDDLVITTSHEKDSKESPQDP